MGLLKTDEGEARKVLVTEPSSWALVNQTLRDLGLLLIALKLLGGNQVAEWSWVVVTMPWWVRFVGMIIKTFAVEVTKTVFTRGQEGEPPQGTHGDA